MHDDPAKRAAACCAPGSASAQSEPVQLGKERMLLNRGLPRNSLSRDQKRLIAARPNLG